MGRNCKDWIDSYLQYTNKSEPSKLYHLWVAISVIAGALQRKCMLKIGQLTFHTNQYIVLVGPPAARKGTAIKPGRRFLEELGVDLAASSGSIEAIAKKLAKMTDDTILSMDSDGVPLEHSSLTIISEELTVLIKKKDERFVDVMTDWFDCAEFWSHEVISREVDNIRGVWVNLLAATTPEKLRTDLSPSAIGSGLTSRMIFVYAQGVDHLDPFPESTFEEEKLYQDLLQDLKRIHFLEGNFRLSDKYKELYTEWYHEKPKGEVGTNKYFEGYLGRRARHLHSLCMVLNASRTDSKKITEVDFKRGKEILEKTEKVMPLAFRGIGRRDHAAVYADLITILREKKQIAFGELLELFSYDADKDTIMKILVDMTHTNIVTFTKVTRDQFTKELTPGIIIYKGEELD